MSFRKSFPEFFTFSDEELKQFWAECFFAFDSNVLLGLYRYSPDLLTKFFTACEALGDRLWIPHHSALEYLRGRHSAAHEALRCYDSATSLLVSFKKQVQDKFNHPQHKVLSTEVFKKMLCESLKPLEEKIATLRQEHGCSPNRDTVLQKLEVLLVDNIGPKFDQDVLKKVRDTAAQRFEEGIPPGFCDALKKKKEGLDPYGDVVIWLQCLEEVKQRKSPLCFVTNDAKEDWWEKDGDKLIGPRTELIREVLEVGEKFFLCSVPQFLSNFVKFSASTDQAKYDSAIRELEDLDTEDISMMEVVENTNSAVAPSRTISSLRQQYLELAAVLQSVGKPAKEAISELEENFKRPFLAFKSSDNV